MKNKIYICIVLFLISANNLSAQDPFFSQYFNTTATLSPALVSSQSANSKIASVFRNQWWGGASKPYNTSFLSFETKLAKQASSQDYFGWGLMAMTENSNGGILKKETLNATGVYHNALDGEGKEMLSGAISLSYTNRLVDASKFITQSQFGSYGFSSSRAAYEPISLANNKYVDVNFGIGYKNRQDKAGYRFGFAMFNVLPPKGGASYFDENYRSKRRYVMEGEYYIGSEFQSFWTISANSQFIGPFNLTSVGAMYSTPILENEYRVALGGWVRWNDSFYPYLSVEKNNWKLGLSYDVLYSPVRTSYNKVQSLELSMSWNFNKKLFK
jgi:type IX secretion system PorP/SprF family membrane protein